ncbi:SDR family NAD(P)-dependent oxidoreductase [Rhodococcus jostii]|uniref:SDR family NAD(P)-dependent oxidoreductase n=1 Tax=Rhodococcus jostii TaxID=132919 RepID=UPI00365DF7A1
MTVEPQTGSLDGLVAVFTGSGRGIGQGIALRLAQGGAAVVGLDLGEQSETGQLVEAIDALWSAHDVDITDADRVTDMVAEVVDRHGRIDILVNNAGIDDAVGFDELDPARWRQIQAVNLEAPFVLAKAIVPIMRRHGYGRIINISSGSVLSPMTGFIAYRSAKMGIIGLTRALATELGVDGITVNAVSPGVIATPMAIGSLPEEFLNDQVSIQGIKRLGAPSDVAHVVAFLAGAEASFVTGQNISVNGGSTFV